MSHVVLLGDSIFDNGVYVPGRPPVIEQLKSWLGSDWQATLAAQDGATTGSMEQQTQNIPSDATHLVLSLGGNDALGHVGIIEAALSGPEILTQLAAIQQEFHRDYSAVIRQLLAENLPTAICTIYDAVPALDERAYMALSVFNDVILREGIRHRLPVLDLRLICSEERDYSELSPIEPSEIGGAKIAQAIRRVLLDQPFGGTSSAVYGG